MELSVHINNIDTQNIYFVEKKKNIIVDGEFVKILYSTDIFEMNGLYICVKWQTIKDTTSHQYQPMPNRNMPKRTITINPNSIENINQIDRLCEIECEIIERYIANYCPTKTASYILKTQLLSGTIKYHSDNKECVHLGKTPDSDRQRNVKEREMFYDSGPIPERGHNASASVGIGDRYAFSLRNSCVVSLENHRTPTSLTESPAFFPVSGSQNVSFVDRIMRFAVNHRTSPIQIASPKSTCVSSLFPLTFDGKSSCAISSELAVPAYFLGRPPNSPHQIRQHNVRERKAFDDSTSTEGRSMGFVDKMNVHPPAYYSPILTSEKCILKISGVWETPTNVGITMKFILLRSGK